jgi:hypothetical protein
MTTLKQSNVFTEDYTMRNLGFLALALGSLVFTAGPAAAQSGPTLSEQAQDNGFGRKSVWAFSSDSALTIQHSSQDVTTIQLAPSVDYFVLDNFSVGGFVSFAYSSSGAGDGTRIGIGPRVGYNFKLSDTLSVWPKAGFAYAYSSSTVSQRIDDDTTREVSTSGSALAMNLFVPVMIHPAPHFFGGFGPFLDVDLSGDERVTVFGAKLTLGGWIL